MRDTCRRADGRGGSVCSDEVEQGGEEPERARSAVPCVECSGTGWLAAYQRDGSATADSCRDCGGSGLRAALQLSEANLRGSTVLLATHDRELIRTSGRRAITLEHGRITEEKLSRPERVVVREGVFGIGG